MAHVRAHIRLSTPFGVDLDARVHNVVAIVKAALGRQIPRENVVSGMSTGSITMPEIISSPGSSDMCNNDSMRQLGCRVPICARARGTARCRMQWPSFALLPPPPLSASQHLSSKAAYSVASSILERFGNVALLKADLLRRRQERGGHVHEPFYGPVRPLPAGVRGPADAHHSRGRDAARNEREGGTPDGRQARPGSPPAFEWLPILALGDR